MRNTVSLSVVQIRNCHAEFGQCPSHSGLNKERHVLEDVLQDVLEGAGRCWKNARMWKKARRQIK
jgi:hypothetical protein